MKENVEEAVRWYSENKYLYERLALKVENTIKEILDSEKIPYYSINSRAKEVDSFGEKAKNTKYSDPKSDIKDLAGIRVIAYVDSDVNRICEIINSEFKVFPEHSVNKTQSLGIDKVGYRSVHFVASFSERRSELLEYRQYINCCFEIQVRSILQHAWAEIEHDRRYKFHGVLPEYLQRRFSVLAGVLELADREFDSIASEIDRYAEGVSEDTEKGNLDIDINSTSLREFMILKFSDKIGDVLKLDVGAGSADKVIIEEMKDFGITTLAELDNIIPDDYNTKAPWIGSTTLNGLLRNIMIINNAERYFEVVWKGHWKEMDPHNLDVFNYYGVLIWEYAEKYGFRIDVNY